MTFEVARGRNLVVNNKDNRVFMSRNYRSDRTLPLGNLMFLTLTYLPWKLRFSGKYLFFMNIKFPRGNYQPTVPRICLFSFSNVTFGFTDFI